MNSYHDLTWAPVALGETTRSLIPIGHQPVGYYLRRLHVAHGLPQRFLWQILVGVGSRPARRLLFSRYWTWHPTDFTLHPLDATASGPGLWEEASELLHVLRSYAGSLPGLALDDTRGSWQPLLLRDYDERPRQHLILFPFYPGEADPSVVVKLRNVSSARASLREERDSLEAARARLPTTLRDTVPSPLAFLEAQGVEVLVTSHLPGRPAYADMQNCLRPHRLAAVHFRMAAEWLAAFHIATRTPGRRYVPGEAETRLAALSAGGGASWLGALVRLCAQHDVPLAARHGDFWARNLLLPLKGHGAEGNPLPNVVDWEDFEPEASPHEDLLHFPVTYGMSYPWRRSCRVSLPEAFRRTFMMDNPVAREVQRYLARYCALALFPAALLKPFLHLYLLGQAARSEGAQRGEWLACDRLLADTPAHAFPSDAPAPLAR
jgi:hypothetical protein